MNRNDIEIAIDILKVEIPMSLKSHAKKIIIYGSCARGDFSEDSDIDVAILTDCNRLEAKKFDDSLMDVVTHIAMKTDAIVEYICIPEKEFSEKKSEPRQDLRTVGGTTVRGSNPQFSTF